MASPTQTVRIIGGKWRSRRIQFANLPTLRPTQDRIRETLFNWLMPFLKGATCLDLFAGSGALGFEALSRGARFTCFVDQHPEVLHEIALNAKQLAIDSDQFAIIQGDCPEQVPALPQAPFDIIFLDPPFSLNLCPETIDWLIKNEYTHAGSIIYLETERTNDCCLPDGWHTYRKKETKALVYQLIQKD